MLFCSSLIFAKGAGSTAAEFLAIQPGASTSGMGETGVAEVCDGNALYWNPAGLALLKTPEISITHMIYIQELNYDYMAYSRPTNKYGTFAAGAIALYSGNIPKTSENSLGNYLDTGQSFTSMEYAILFGWGKQIDKKLSLGLSVKSITQTIDAVSASGFAGDVGIDYALRDKLRIGMAVQNLGSQIKGNDLPTNVKMGCNVILPSHFVSISADADYAMADELSFGVGIEKIIKGLIAVRVGYNTRTETTLGLTGIHAGLGIIWQRLKFDYAFGTYGEIGMSHMLSIGINF